MVVLDFCDDCIRCMLAMKLVDLFFLNFWQCLGTSLAVPVNPTLSNREVFE